MGTSRNGACRKVWVQGLYIRGQREGEQGTEKLVIEGVMVAQLWTGRAQSPWGMWRTCVEYTPELNESILSPHFHPSAPHCLAALALS